jgi:hypothetical protein
MPLSSIKENAIRTLFGLASIALVGSWLWLANVAATQDDLASDHRLWEEKLNTLVEDVKEIKVTLKELTNQPPMRAYPTGLSPDERRTMDQIADALRRQNCFLAGGTGPACQNIR